MTSRRRKLSLLSWEPFLLGVVLLSALAASMTLRLGVVGTIVGVVAVFVAAPAAVRLIVLGIRTGGDRNSSARLATTAGFELREATVDGVLVLEETARRQDSIDLALGWTGEAMTVVLWPGATRWLGRELRVEAYFIGENRPARAGFLPRAVDDSVGPALEALRADGILMTVPAWVLGNGRRPDPTRPFTRLARPLTVEIGRPADGSLQASGPE
jgi:hypothetical protein